MLKWCFTVIVIGGEAANVNHMFKSVTLKLQSHPERMCNIFTQNAALLYFNFYSTLRNTVSVLPV